MRLKQLTSAEENIMQILWRLNEALVKDIIREMPAPRPAYNTVSTVIRVLEKKKFVAHKPEGNAHIYFPLVAEKEYRLFAFNRVFSNYFDSSVKNLFSFLVEKKDISDEELGDLHALLKSLKNKKP